MATPADQHDTLVLSPHTGAQVHPVSGYSSTGPYATPAGYAPMGPYGPTAWSQVPPFLPSAAPVAAPVLVMRNNAAVVGATLGSVSLFLSLIPLLGIVAWVLAPIGLLSSGIGLLVGMSRKVGRVGALWGLLTSAVALLVCIAWMALVLAL